MTIINHVYRLCRDEQKKIENLAYQISVRINSIQSLVKPLAHMQTTTIKYLNSNAHDSNKH